MFGVAVRGVGAARMSRLLGAGGHAGRGPRALHVDDHRRDLGVVGQPDELVHQRDAGTRRRGEGARAVPAGADHHADGGQLVLGLQDAVVLLAGLGILAVLLAELLEGVHHRGGRGDGVPGGHGGARVQAAQGGGGVAVDQDPVLGRVHLLPGGSAAGRTGCRWRSRSPAGSPCGSSPSGPSCAPYFSSSSPSMTSMSMSSSATSTPA